MRVFSLPESSIKRAAEARTYQLDIYIYIDIHSLIFHSPSNGLKRAHVYFEADDNIMDGACGYSLKLGWTRQTPHSLCTYYTGTSSTTIHGAIAQCVVFAALCMLCLVRSRNKILFYLATQRQITILYTLLSRYLSSTLGDILNSDMSDVFFILI